MLELGNITFKDMTLVVNGTTIYGNGNELVVSEDATFDGTVAAIYGGGKANAVWSTNLTLLAGNYTEIYGGSNGGMVLGDTNVVVGGNVNSGIKVSDHGISNRIYGGCYNEADAGLFSTTYFTGFYVTGNTEVNIGDNANYTHSGSLETAICAGSRHKTNHKEENAVLNIETNSLYDKLKSYIGSGLIDIKPGYDTLYVAGVKK